MSVKRRWRAVICLNGLCALSLLGMAPCAPHADLHGHLDGAGSSRAAGRRVFESAQATLNILAFGDSLTEGLITSQQGGAVFYPYAHVLQELLAKHRPVQVSF